MPSKRKKNKRRMRKVQAQRKALEERFASSGRGTQGVCAVPVLVPVRKRSPDTLPTTLPVIATIHIPDEIPPAELVTLEVTVTDAIKDTVVKDAEDLGQPPVEPPAIEPDVTEEGENIVIPVSEVTSSIDEPVTIPAESEVQFEDTTSVATETRVVAQPVETVDTEREVEAELPAEDPVVEVPVPETVTVTAAEEVAAVETVTETIVPEVEFVASAAVEVDGHIDGVAEEPAVEAEAISVETEPAEVFTEVTEDVKAEPEPEEFPVEAAVPTDALVEAEPEQKQLQQPVLLDEPTPSVESTSDPIAEELVVTESVAADLSVAEEQIPDTTTHAPEVLSETLSERIPAPETLPVPVAKEIIQAQDEFIPEVETETIKDLAVAGGLTVDAINGCLGATEVAIEG